MIVTLKIVVSCDILSFEENYQGIFLAMHFPRLVNMLQRMNFFVKF
jgi:hypothetical protein